MPIKITRTELFPDDTNELPRPGTEAQGELIADEEQIADESYLDTIKSFDALADEVYREVSRNALNVLQAVGRTRDLRVLDLGSGTALETHALLQGDVTVSELTLVDYSAKTLDLATTLLRRTPDFHKVGHVTAVPLDLLAHGIKDHLAGRYDLVLTCNSFMHFPREDHRRIFADVRSVLSDDGVFIFQSHFRILEREWKKAIIGGMQTRMASQGAPPALIEQAGRHLDRFHHFHNLHEVYGWLEGAGFGYFDCAYRNRMLGIFVAVK